MDKVQNVINRIRPPRNNPYTKETPVIARNSDRKTDNVQISTDGGGYVNKRGFIGWGYYMSRFSNGKLVDRAAGYGSNVHGTTMEAELSAVLDGIREAKKRAGAVSQDGVLKLTSPLRMTVTTDCLRLIEGLHNFETIATHARNIEKIPKSQRSVGHENKLKEFSVWKAIRNEMEKDPNLIELNTQWIRSHVLDVIPEENWPVPKDARNKDERNLIHLLYGNRNADDQASMGIRQGIKDAIDYFNKRAFDRTENPVATYQQEIKKIATNFQNSKTAVNIAIDYLATKPPGFLSKQDTRALFAASVMPELKDRDIRDLTSKDYGGRIGTQARDALTPNERGKIVAAVNKRIEKTREKYAVYMKCEAASVPETFKRLSADHQLEWVEFNYRSREREMREQIKKQLSISATAHDQNVSQKDEAPKATRRREHDTLFGARP